MAPKTCAANADTETTRAATTPPGILQTRPCSVSVIVPVYNEERTIAAILRKVQEVRLDGLQKEIVVVDDGSTDRTVEQLQRFGDEIRLVRHPKRLGKGAAVRTGFLAATGDILVIQDADLEYDPQDFPRLVEPLLRGDVDAVLGSRFLVQKPQFFTRDGSPFFSHYIGNTLIIWLTNWLYGFCATDYEGCYKAFRADVIRATPPVEADGFEFDNELICKLLRQKRRISEVPIHYNPRVYQEGKKIRWQHGVRMLWTILKWRVWPLSDHA
jgi:glycosyltransferase involved in cell wall biosynthesis